MKAKKPPLAVVERKDGYVHLCICGKTYLIEDRYDDSPIRTIRRNDEDKLVCDRPRDFGGCGKDAMKMEKNVPLTIWLQEVHAIELKGTHAS